MAIAIPWKPNPYDKVQQVYLMVILCIFCGVLCSAAARLGLDSTGEQERIQHERQHWLMEGMSLLRFSINLTPSWLSEHWQLVCSSKSASVVGFWSALFTVHRSIVQCVDGIFHIAVIHNDLGLCPWRRTCPWEDFCLHCTMVFLKLMFKPAFWLYFKKCQLTGKRYRG